MSRRLFGTDGIRARFGDEPLTAATVPLIGYQLGKLLGETRPEPTVLITGDTRESTPALTRWLASGLTGAGARVVNLGTLPTGAIAHLVPRRGAAAGVVLSASHNPAADNGIKLVDAQGYKWSAAAESELEERIEAAAAAAEPVPLAEPVLESSPDARREYFASLIRQLEGPSALTGLRIALDFANGAAAGWTDLFSGSGATVTSYADRPNGGNINHECGATHPQALAHQVVAGEFDLGFAFDGDADRAILIDETGAVRDGDAMLYLWARDLAARGELPQSAIVATSMSNLGLERALRADGVEIVRCDVGDRAVVGTLRSRGLRLGGEQSGHLVDLARSTTGDGLLTALMLAQIIARQDRPLSEQLVGFRRFPQVLLNVRVSSRPDLSTLPAVAAATRQVEDALGDEGRLVLRYSGTEPLVRIMIEGPDETSVAALAEGLAATIRAEIGVG